MNFTKRGLDRIGFLIPCAKQRPLVNSLSAAASKVLACSLSPSKIPRAVLDEVVCELFWVSCTYTIITSRYENNRPADSDNKDGNAVHCECFECLPAPLHSVTDRLDYSLFREKIAKWNIYDRNKFCVLLIVSWCMAVACMGFFIDLCNYKSICIPSP